MSLTKFQKKRVFSPEGIEEDLQFLRYQITGVIMGGYNGTQAIHPFHCHNLYRTRFLLNINR